MQIWGCSADAEHPRPPPLEVTLRRPGAGLVAGNCSSLRVAPLQDLRLLGSPPGPGTRPVVILLARAPMAGSRLSAGPGLVPGRRFAELTRARPQIPAQIQIVGRPWQTGSMVMGFGHILAGSAQNLAPGQCNSVLQGYVGYHCMVENDSMGDSPLGVYSQEC